MGISIGDALSFFEAIRGAILRHAEKKKEDEVIAIRRALKHVYFSAKTVEMLKQADWRNHSSLIVALQDSHADVKDAMWHLGELIEYDGLSTGTGRLLADIQYNKARYREQIGHILHDAGNASDEVKSELVMNILKLNEAIEQVDDRFGKDILRDA